MPAQSKAPQESASSAKSPPDPIPKRRRPRVPKPIVAKRPSACLNPDRPPPDEVWENKFREKEGENFECLIEIYLHRVGTRHELLRLPSYELHAAKKDDVGACSPAPHWSENVRRRLEARSERFWKPIFKYNAPDLFEEVIAEGLTLPPQKVPLPQNFFGIGASLCTNEIQNMRRELLFHWSKDPDNLRALDFSPENHSKVVDGHLCQVSTPASFFTALCYVWVLVWDGELAAHKKV